MLIAWGTQIGASDTVPTQAVTTNVSYEHPVTGKTMQVYIVPKNIDTKELQDPKGNVKQAAVVPYWAVRETLDPNDVNSLGAEYNANIGKNERYRAMFIVDRSIPVGFDPGKDLNARDVVVFESHDQ